MNIAVIGSGYVGTTTALVLASMGHQVIGVDIDRSKVDKLKQGSLPFVEPGLDQLLIEMLDKGSVDFTDQIQVAIRDSDVLFITVGTPSREDGRADLSFLQSVADMIATWVDVYKVIVVKSTVPLGTNKWLSNYLLEKIGDPSLFDVLSNPEFLREGVALHDSLHPNRTVIGGVSERAITILKEVFTPLDSKVLVTDWETAELIKYASNSFLATKISFINEIARIADKTGADVQKVALGMGMDSRIGFGHLYPGIGYGGSCFPKDVKALIATAKEVGADYRILDAVEYVNQSQPTQYLEKLILSLEEFVEKPWTIAILGLAFKADTDDQRESPAIRIVDLLLSNCSQIRIVDPTIQTQRQTPWEHHEKIVICTSVEEAVFGADAAILCTNWESFAKIDWKEVSKLMRNQILVDGRNVFDPETIRSTGVHYIGLGRGKHG